MRSLASYILAAFAIAMALDFVVPTAGSERWPSVEMGAPRLQQNVNRDAKSDRLNATGRGALDKTVRDVPLVTPVRRQVPEGCDPAFSPLSASARLNYASRCVA
jgi:hypothetical protein